MTSGAAPTASRIPSLCHAFVMITPTSGPLGNPRKRGSSPWFTFPLRVALDPRRDISCHRSALICELLTWVHELPSPAVKWRIPARSRTISSCSVSQLVRDALECRTRRVTESCQWVPRAGSRMIPSYASIPRWAVHKMMPNTDTDLRSIARARVGVRST